VNKESLVKLEPQEIDLLYGRKGPTVKQELFRDHPAKYRLYGGAVGGGKSWAICAEGLRVSLAYPGNKGFMCRHESTSFKNTTLATLMKLIGELEELTKKKILVNHHRTDRVITLINGSVIVYGALGDSSDVERIKSLEIGWFAIDEASETAEGNYQMLKSRLRWRLPNGGFPPFFGLLASNPEPGWVKNTFVTPEKMGMPLPNHVFIQALPLDNPHLPPDYLEDLRASNPEHWVVKYIEGSWDALKGQIFDGFNSEKSVIDPFDIPSNWLKFRTLDHGQNNPTCCLWCAVDPDSNIFVYREYYSSGVVSKHCKEINRLSEGEEYEYTVLPHDLWNKTREKDGNLWSVYNEYVEHGIYGIRANNEVNAGLNRVNEFFFSNSERIHPITEEKGSPRLFIFSNCRNLILEIPDYIWKDGEDKPVKVNDHACDALRYGIMTRPSPALEDEVIPINSFMAMRKRMIQANKRAERRGTSPYEEYRRI